MEQNGNGTRHVVVIRDNPLFDDILALRLYAETRQLELADVNIHLWAGSVKGRNKPEEEELQEYEEMGAFLINIGPRKYTTLGIGSASEFVLRHFNILQFAGVKTVFDLTHQWCVKSDAAKALAVDGVVRWAGRRVPAMELLRENCTKPQLLPYLEAVMVASRNNATGYLKQSPKSFVKLLRRLYELEITVPEVIDLIWGPVDAQLCADTTATVEERTVQDLFDHPKLGAYFGPDVCGKQFHLFTLARYLRDLWLLGEHPEEVAWLAENVLKYWDYVEDAEKRGRAELAMVTDQMEFAGGQAVSLSTDNPFATRAVWKDQEWVKVVMVRKSSGNVTILTRGLYTRDLYRVLKSMEPGLWYHQCQTDTLINGGLSYRRVKPSALTSELLMELVEKHVFNM